MVIDYNTDTICIGSPNGKKYILTLITEEKEEKERRSGSKPAN